MQSSLFKRQTGLEVEVPQPARRGPQHRAVVVYLWQLHTEPFLSHSSQVTPAQVPAPMHLLDCSESKSVAR